MDVLGVRPTSALLAIPAVAFFAVSYGVYKFTTPIAPGIPYAGGNSFSARLQVPVEYGKDPVEFLRKTRKQLGDVFCVDLLIVKFVFFLGAQYNRTILRAPENELSFWDQVRWAMGPRADAGQWAKCASCLRR